MNLSLKEIQTIELNILDSVHSLCAENNITYYLAYGSMLGAVRHQGFIPWDDDIDLVMPRKDYERFLDLAPRHLPGHLNLKYSDNTDPYLYDFAKVEDSRTLLIEDTYRYLNINSAVYIDIFPMDGSPSSARARRFHLLHINVWQHLLAMYYADSNKGRSLWKRPIVALVKRLLSQQSINRHIRKLMMKYEYDTSDIVGYYEGRLNELVPKAVLGEPKLFLFEEREFWGVAEPDRYLTSLYGDYRQLPPEDQRQAHFHSVVKWL